METALLMTLVAAVLLAVIMYRMKKSRERKLLLVQRMRTSGMYSALHDLLMTLDPDRVERLTVRPDRVEIVLLPNERMDYDMAAAKLDPLKTELLETLMQCIVIDLPSLQTSGHYSYDSSASRSASQWLSFTMKSKRKDYLMKCMTQNQAH